MSERKMEVEAWLSQPLTQEFLALVMRSAAQSREMAVETLAPAAKGACDAYRFVINEIIGVAMFASDAERRAFMAEAPEVVEDALVAMRRSDG